MDTRLDGHGLRNATTIKAPGFKATLILLAESFDLARELQCNHWDFAVEIALVRAAGASHGTLRAMVCAKLLEHADEESNHDGTSRHFLQNGLLQFTDRTCFVLTERGRRVAATVVGADTPPADASPSRAESRQDETRHGFSKPRWVTTQHRDRRLCVGEVTVARYTRKAPHQERILAAFEEEGWPRRIADPLPMIQGVEPVERLHDTLKHLNRHIRPKLIEFRRDGSGTGILWEPVGAAAGRFSP